MPITATSIDPLAHFLEAIIRRGGKTPIPLVATRIDVTIHGGLATVTTERTFRNTEKQSIEATMTFPVPVDATLCALTAKIGGRTLNAVAQARRQARDTYEDALDKGKSAVLHEELLKGIHMLSVGHVGADAEIAVTDIWTAPLSFADETPRLRIPTTVSEIYGQSPLAPSDDLVTDDVTHQASIGVACEDGTVALLRAGAPVDGRYSLMLDQPIDIVVNGWRSRTLSGTAADGRSVTLDIEPSPKSEGRLDVAILFDHSGSMDERAAGDYEVSLTKFDVAKVGLVKAAHDALKPADRLRIWQFDDRVDFLGEASAANGAELARKIQNPAGGTEIGLAFERAIADGARNIVLITDGQSWALDPQRLASAGIRVTAVLVGEGSLEGGIGHLAGLTGGQVFVATGSEAGSAIITALDAARSPRQAAKRIAGKPARVETLRRGARIVATWGGKAEGDLSADARRIGATAAMLAIPLMADEAAAKLAEAEGIVCHFTSLVLVDEAGVRHEGIPAVRKVALSKPLMMSLGRMSGRARAMAAPASMLCDDEPRPRGRLAKFEIEEEIAPVRKSEADYTPLVPAKGRSGNPSHLPPVNLGRLVGRIDWEMDPRALRRGDLTGLAPELIAAIEAASQLPAIVAFAKATGIGRIVVVIGLLARAAGGKSRAAQRIARAIFGGAPVHGLADAMGEVGL